MTPAVEKERSAEPPIIASSDFEAAVFDLDGVLTQTAQIHALAWKALFDDFLREYAKRHKLPFKPFDIERDYSRYVDGKPRHDGVETFLRSRGIEIPRGHPGDAAGKSTIHGLGNSKNRLFLALLEKHGVKVFRSSIELVKKMRDGGLRTAVVSSSRNCGAVIQRAGLAGLFDARVDGVDLQELGLAGKPAPDIYQEALRRLGCPARRAIVFEDALAGVEAGRKAGFGLVVGVARTNPGPLLQDHGADFAVADLAEITFLNASSALENFDRIRDEIEGRSVLLFLDYDGTLTPIVDDPAKAVLSDAMRSTLERLARQCPVAVVSGRDLDDVRSKVGIADICYAGSHGFDIAGPDTRHIEFQKGKEYEPAIADLEHALEAKLEGIPGIMVERKRFSLAVHFRRAGSKDRERAQALARQTLADWPQFQVSPGKMILDICPDIEWDKGRAVHWIAHHLALDARAIKIYIGDDTTDEDAFRALQDDGIGIAVLETPRPTSARFFLRNTTEVETFLNRISALLEARPR